MRAHRLVTLTGVGGVGKTRLAFEAAAQMSDEFPDGVWLFEFAAVNGSGRGSRRGRRGARHHATAGQDRGGVGGRSTRRPGPACWCSTTASMCSMRRPIWSRPSSRNRRPSKSWRPAGKVWRRRRAGVAGAIVGRATRRWTCSSSGHAVSRKAFRPMTRSVIAEICRRLDGIPLAIELAASRMASMTADEVRDRLDHRFRLLVGSRRGLERHQTLRHAVQWSYDLLDDAEKALLERCSVFAGGFDLESACAVAGSEPTTSPMLDLLDALVRKSLLVADRSSGRTRFSMLETIRQFAEEQLAARGEANEVRARARPLFRRPRSRHASRYGTVPDSARRTTGLPPNWPICAPRFGGPPTRRTSTARPPS